MAAADKSPQPARASSDRPFLVALAVLGGVYVVLIVGMLAADILYLATDQQIKTADLDFEFDDAGRTLKHGDVVSTQFDRRGVTIRSHSPDFPATIFSHLPGDDKNERLDVPLLGISRADEAAGPRIYLGPDALLIFQWDEPVELRLIDFAHLPAGQTATARFLGPDGKQLDIRQVTAKQDQLDLQLLLLDDKSSGLQNISTLELSLPQGGFVSRLRYFWQGRTRAAWEKDHPLLSRIVYNPMTDALRKKEIRYAIKLSLISCTVTAILSLWIAIPIGYLLSRYRFRGHNLIDAIVDIPIVLPPLVVGLSLLILFQYVPLPFLWLATLFNPEQFTSDSLLLPGPFSVFMYRLFDIVFPLFDGIHFFLKEKVVYHIPAVILAQFMVAAAFAVRTMRATFDQIDSRREQVALTLGCSRWQSFSRVVLPEARSGVLTAATLAWARALGEFGPLLIFAGATRMKTEVLSTTIFLELNVGDTAAAVAVSLIMVTGAMIVLIIARVWGNRATI